MLSVPELFSAIQTQSEKFTTSSDENSNGSMGLFALLFILFIIVFIIVLYVWAFKILYFPLPMNIRILCILFMLTGHPVYAIIFGYLFGKLNVGNM